MKEHLRISVYSNRKWWIWTSVAKSILGLPKRLVNNCIGLNLTFSRSFIKDLVNTLISELDWEKHSLGKSLRKYKGNWRNSGRIGRRKRSSDGIGDIRSTI